MTDEELVPEIHDILKLCENTEFPGVEGAVSPHSNPHLVYNYNKIENSTFEGVCKHHHGKDFEIFPDSSSLFLLDMADNLAASTSRVGIRNIGTNDMVFKLWKNSFKKIKNKNVYFRPLNLDEILKFISENSGKEDFFEKYYNYLIQRAEDSTLGANITSLYTHSALTGKFYRILRDAGYSIEDELLNNVSKEIITNIYNEKENEWILNVIRIKLRFSQKPFRVKDLNIFRSLKSTIEKINNDLSDFILFSASEELLLVLPQNREIDLLKQFLSKYNFWFEFAERSQTIRNVHPDPEKLNKEAKNLKNEAELKIKQQLQRIPKSKQKKAEIGVRKSCEKPWKKKIEEIEKEKNNYLMQEGTEYIELFSEIKPPICEICQMAPAEYPRIDEKSEIKEELCKYCQKIQEEGESLKKLAKWTYEDGIRTAWLKISIDFDILIDALKELYIKYLKDLEIPNPEENADIRFSVISEFQWDYENFLSLFNDHIISEFGEENVEQVLDDLLCIKIEKSNNVEKILRIYNSLINEYFPRFKKTVESPIKLVISESNVKYPFFEHWKYLDNPESDIDIKLTGKGEMKVKLSHLSELLNLNLGGKTALYKLAKMADVSKELAYMEIVSIEGKKDHPDLQKAIFKMGFEPADILTYIKIKSD
jgi:hypothetical protein